MKIALYIEDGLEQVVLTPQTPTEKTLLGKLFDGKQLVEIKRGSFYECQGGYMRHPSERAQTDESVMLVLREPKAAP